MADFGIRFLISNFFICAITGLLLLAKLLLKNCLTSRMQFNVWFLLLSLLAVPFLPFCPTGFPQVILWLLEPKSIPFTSSVDVLETTAPAHLPGTFEPVNDFAISVGRGMPAMIGTIFCAIWLSGVLIMVILTLKSKAGFNRLKKSALPLQNREIRILYKNCLAEMNIKRRIPIYSTAFLKSPILAGFFKPCIYLPIHLISDISAIESGTPPDKSSPLHTGGQGHLNPVRFMLLHELMHYKHKDACANYLMNLAVILYWFNPMVWYALKEMRTDREIACDACVLRTLEAHEYKDYGNTLINFAEKISLMPFPFTAGLSGSIKQIQKRIVHIASYQKPSTAKKWTGCIILGIITALFWSLSPVLSTYAADQNKYQWDISAENISIINLSPYFEGYDGSFVLYDLKSSAWGIYHMDSAVLRTSPNSTYKIYSALFGLKEGIITPEDSFIAWDGNTYPYDTWNASQNLDSAMRYSVNWYFQAIDRQLGISAIKQNLKKLSYGNEKIQEYPADISAYWMESSLKISPVEQVQLLTKLYDNKLGFSPEHINAVKNSLLLSSRGNSSLYGKTGTGQVNGQNINGWFIGYVQSASNTYFFASNIQGQDGASGSKAAEITYSILADMDIWPQ